MTDRASPGLVERHGVVRGKTADREQVVPAGQLRGGESMAGRDCPASSGAGVAVVA